MGETFRQLATDGPLLLAIAAAALAGLVSFLSPCVLPLMPGYLSYVTGLAGADLDAALGVRPTSAPTPAPAGAVATPATTGSVAVAELPTRPPAGGRGRVLAGTALFVLGFTVVFIPLIVLVTRLGTLLGTYRRAIDIGVGLLVIVFGLVFLGRIPGMQRELRIHRLPAAGLGGAPVLGAIFCLSWLPCVGPTLGAVIGLATTSGGTDRAVVLGVAYCLGLGVPFMVFGLAFRRLLGVFRVIRRNSRWVTRAGGTLLIVMGVIMISGGWNDVVIWLRTTFSAGVDLGTLL